MQDQYARAVGGLISESPRVPSPPQCDGTSHSRRGTSGGQHDVATSPALRAAYYGVAVSLAAYRGLAAALVAHRGVAASPAPPPANRSMAAPHAVDCDVAASPAAFHDVAPGAATCDVAAPPAVDCDVAAPAATACDVAAPPLAAFNDLAASAPVCHDVEASPIQLHGPVLVVEPPGALAVPMDAGGSSGIYSRRDWSAAVAVHKDKQNQGAAKDAQTENVEICKNLGTNAAAGETGARDRATDAHRENAERQTSNVSRVERQGADEAHRGLGSMAAVSGVEMEDSEFVQHVGVGEAHRGLRNQAAGESAEQENPGGVIRRGIDAAAPYGLRTVAVGRRLVKEVVAGERGERLPGGSLPGERLSGGPLPGEPLPGGPLPGERLSEGPLPGEPLPAGAGELHSRTACRIVAQPSQRLQLPLRTEGEQGEGQGGEVEEGERCESGRQGGGVEGCKRDEGQGCEVNVGHASLCNVLPFPPPLGGNSFHVSEGGSKGC